MNWPPQSAMLLAATREIAPAVIVVVAIPTEVIPLAQNRVVGKVDSEVGMGVGQIHVVQIHGAKKIAEAMDAVVAINAAVAVNLHEANAVEMIEAEMIEVDEDARKPRWLTVAVVARQCRSRYLLRVQSLTNSTTSLKTMI